MTGKVGKNQNTLLAAWADSWAASKNADQDIGNGAVMTLLAISTSIYQSIDSRCYLGLFLKINLKIDQPPVAYNGEKTNLDPEMIRIFQLLIVTSFIVQK